jgi:hypothetical protein
MIFETRKTANDPSDRSPQPATETARDGESRQVSWWYTKQMETGHSAHSNAACGAEFHEPSLHSMPCEACRWAARQWSKQSLEGRCNSATTSNRGAKWPAGHQTFRRRLRRQVARLRPRPLCTPLLANLAPLFLPRSAARRVSIIESGLSVQHLDQCVESGRSSDHGRWRGRLLAGCANRLLLLAHGGPRTEAPALYGEGMLWGPGPR